MKFSEVKVGQKFKRNGGLFIKLSTDIFIDIIYSVISNAKTFFDNEMCAEVELITKCSICVHCYSEDTPSHNDNKQAYKCVALDVWIEKVKYLGGGQSDLREDPETFSCSLFEERGEDE